MTIYTTHTPNLILVKVVCVFLTSFIVIYFTIQTSEVSVVNLEMRIKDAFLKPTNCKYYLYCTLLRSYKKDFRVVFTKFLKGIHM